MIRDTQRLNMENATMNGHTDTITVTTKTIETICDELNLKHINYLSVDVEGAEFEVIKSINFDKVFIDVVGFENNYPDVGDVIIQYLQSKNYKVIYQCMDVFMLHADSAFEK